jgi:hypothetical protein
MKVVLFRESSTIKEETLSEGRTPGLRCFRLIEFKELRSDVNKKITADK